jgi:hypothetical protein
VESTEDRKSSLLPSHTFLHFHGSLEVSYSITTESVLRDSKEEAEILHRSGAGFCFVLFFKFK